MKEELIEKICLAISDNYYYSTRDVEEAAQAAFAVMQPLMQQLEHDRDQTERRFAKIAAENMRLRELQPLMQQMEEALEEIKLSAGSYAEGPTDPEFTQFLRIEAIAAKTLARLAPLRGKVGG